MPSCREACRSPAASEKLLLPSQHSQVTGPRQDEGQSSPHGMPGKPRFEGCRQCSARRRQPKGAHLVEGGAHLARGWSVQQWQQYWRMCLSRS